MANLLDPAEAFAVLSAEIGKLEPDELLEVGHAAIGIVVARTRAGLDASGNRFKPYSPGYAKTRVKANLGTQPDLVRTGHMIGGMQPLVTGVDEVTVSFPAQIEATKAGANNDGTRRGIPSREFLDVRLAKEVEFIGEVATAAMARRIEDKLR